MSASESYSDDCLSSAESDFNEVEEYDVEVEEFESQTEVSDAEKSSGSEADVVGSVVVPSDEEPIADEEWVENYEREKENQAKRYTELQERLDGQISTSNWCKCGNCDTSLLQNAYEAQCCQEIERCTETLCSDEVLQDVQTPPTCVLYHPGFRINCLEKWSLKMAVTKYRTKERRRYHQKGSESTFYRSIAYREFSQLIYGILGQLRVPLPACAYNAIREKFPSNDEEFTGFDEDISD